MGLGNQSESTDVKIALLASLLEPATYPVSEYIDALKTANGDVARAAEELLLPRVKSLGKRKAGTSIEMWLGKKKAGKTTSIDTDSSASSPKIPSPTKPPVDLMSILRPSSSTNGTSTATAKTKAAPQPALLLTNQHAISAQGLPLALLQSPLSPSLASALYLAMMEESEKWDRNRFYLAGKWVESPHTTTVYARRGAGYGVDHLPRDADDDRPKPRYFYSGTELAYPHDYPPLLARAADLIEDVVNKAIQSRPRYPLEWGGRWRANVCGANRYDGASSGVGWHADQMTYLGPYCSIASLSLGTPRAFRLRQTDPVDPAFATHTKPIRTYEVNLGHNSLCLMEAGCQERYKHTVPPQKALDLFRPSFSIDEQPIPMGDQKTYTSRINITFRFYREDFHPLPGIGPFGKRQGTPECKCGIPTLLRADQKAKARSRLAPSPTKPRLSKPAYSTASPGRNAPYDEKETLHDKLEVIDDDMMYFWQCQSPGQTGDMKGCGFFKILDMKAEGRGPCVGDM